MDSDYTRRQLHDSQHTPGSTAAAADIQDSEMPLLEQIPSSNPQSTQDVDMDADHSSDDDMPGLQDVSDSDDSGSEFDAEEVELLHAVMDSDDPPIPEVTPIAPSHSRPNRRARVEDDEDEDRDRRHPTERLNTPLSGQSRSSSPPRTQNRQPATNTLPFPFNILGQPTHIHHHTAAPSGNPPPAGEGNNRAAPNFSGIAISFSIDGGGHGPNAPPRQPGDAAAAAGAFPFPLNEAPEGQTFTDFFSGGILNEIFGIEPDVDDPDRAERLINGLEVVPMGLVKRLERVGGMAGANNNELSGGDSGCAVCWEKLLEVEGPEADRTSNDKKDDESTAPVKIVSLPCAHVFHAECLRPWFSRPKQTTCPTCRFNIDPENLTYVPYRQRRAQAQASETLAAEPPTPENAPAATSLAADHADATEGARGRTGPSPDVSSSTQPPRRPSSEPPVNRRPDPADGPARLTSHVVQSFPVPGGHAFIFNHPGPALGPLGQASGGTGNTAQGVGTAAHPTSNTGSPSTANGPPESPAIAAHGTADHAGRSPNQRLPRAGFVAIDLHIPFPPPHPSDAAPTPAGPQPQIRVPGAFAGLNFGNRQSQQPVNVTDILNRMYPPLNSATNASRAGGGASAPPTAEEPAVAPIPTTPAAEPAGEGRTGSQPTSPSADGGNDHAANIAAGDLPNLRAALDTALNNPAFLFRMLMAAAASGATPFPPTGGGGGNPRRTPSTPAPKKDYTLPAAPGPTLRQRVERREREAGLRCYDVSCGIGPSDEEPFVALSDDLKRQLHINPKHEHDESFDEGKLCSHTFHTSCLVSAERVALRGADATIVDGAVEVSCPVCRREGCVSQNDWDEGVLNLR